MGPTGVHPAPRRQASCINHTNAPPPFGFPSNSQLVPLENSAIFSYLRRVVSRVAAMEDGALSAAIRPNSHSLDDVFRDYLGRRAGIIKALTQDVEKFYEQCDPEKDNLCLYGLPNETWKVNMLSEEVPAELPEPTTGINFARDGMAMEDWLLLVAVHSDAWLLSMAFYLGGRSAFDKEARRRLFMMISGLSTVFEVVTKSYKKQVKTPNSNSKNKTGSTPPKQSNSNSMVPKQSPSKLEKDNGARGNRGSEDQALTICVACEETYANGEFWICCDLCERWFHGKCVQMSPGRAENIKQYMCPGCSYKRSKEVFLVKTSNKCFLAERNKKRAWNASAQCG